jgi:hypothetical protein
MKLISHDTTIAKNHIKRWRFLISEYDLIKDKKTF